MRTPQYHSPSSIMQWQKDREEYYIRYLADVRPSRPSQTAPMAVGSAFDAYVKSYLYQKLFGRVDDFGLDALIEQQVEPQCRDEAVSAGGLCFGFYKTSGALSDLMSWLEQASGEPRFESTARGTINHKGHGTVLLGKPDLFFVWNGMNVILDWKVNGYYSSASPAKGYKIARPSGKVHKLYKAMDFGGMEISSLGLEETKADWATQLSIYSWLEGAAVGSQVICCIDQLAWRNSNCNVASHRALVGAEYQESIWDTIVDMDSRIATQHIFEDMDRVSSRARQSLLDGLDIDSHPYGQWWNDNVRRV